MEHFPLFEGKTPGTVALDEARKEAELALDVQQAHLRHYGELVRLPVPLIVLAVPEDDQGPRHRPAPAPHVGAGARARRGLPRSRHRHVRLPLPRSTDPRHRGRAAALHVRRGSADMASRKNIMEKMVPGWIRLAARLLWLGFLPSTPLAGGSARSSIRTTRASTAAPATSPRSTRSPTPTTTPSSCARSPRLSARCAWSSRALRHPAAGAGPELRPGLHDLLSRAVRQARGRARARRPKRATRCALDPRINAVFGGDKSLLELMAIFEQYNGYLKTADYE